MVSLHRKILFSLISLLFLLTLTTPVQYYSSELTTRTTITRTDYLRNNTITYAADNGYATVIKTPTLEEYFDEKGNPVTLPAGYSKVQKSPGLIIYLDDSGVPVVINNGYDSIHRTYNEDGQADTDTYYVGAEQVERKGGYWGYRRVYQDGKVTEIQYLDRDGSLTLNNSGYAVIKRSYADTGRTDMYFGIDGEPVAASLGQYGVHKELDGEGRTISTTYRDAAEDLPLRDWNAVFAEMKEQSVAALPGEWLKAHLPTAKSWLSYCALQQGQWVRVMHGQDELLQLFDAHNIPCAIIKGAAAAIYYPHPTLRSMGDVDVLVKRGDQDRAAKLMEMNGYILTHEKGRVAHHYNYSKDKISFELHRRLPVIDDDNEELLTLFEEGIDRRIWHEIDGYRFPVLPPVLNGLVLIFHINQHLRSGLGLRQIIDWIMYANQLSSSQWEELRVMLKRVDLECLALTTTAMCQKYLGLQKTFSGCDNIDQQVCDELMAFVMEKGNFGRKAGIEGKIEAFAFSSTEHGGFFRRLQEGGLKQWKAVKSYPILRPFAWIYQTFRIFGVLIKNKKSLRDIKEQRAKGLKQRELLEALGLKVDRTVTING